MPRHALDPDHIHLLSWNIAKGRHRDWHQDLTRLTHQADVVAIQEAKLEHSMHQLVTDCCWAFAPGYRRTEHTTGVLTISRAETLERYLHSHREPLIRYPKAALVTEYRLHGRAETLRVANVHAINFTAGTRYFRQQLHEVLLGLREHQGPLIVCGDFNTWRGKRLGILTELVTELTLNPVPFTQDHRRAAFGLALDHIFYRGLHLKEGEVTRVLSSDHNPISVTLGIGPP
jgi:endonuclease/exonuclease/phosphatase (EEP) superfamily protein YafD